MINHFTKVTGGLIWASILCVFLTCSGQRVVRDEIKVLKDGEALSYKMDPGMYKLEMTASNDGASVEWVGSNCPGSPETKSYTSICEFAQTGQIIIKNPSAFGVGAATSVTVKITKL